MRLTIGRKNVAGGDVQTHNLGGSEMARMTVQNIRFGRRDWERIQAAAEEAGVTAAQFVRNWSRTGALLEAQDGQAKTAKQLAREFHRSDEPD